MRTIFALACRVVGVVVLLATPLSAQEILTRARTAPTRADGLAMLDVHLASTPRDIDARAALRLDAFMGRPLRRVAS